MTSPAFFVTSAEKKVAGDRCQIISLLSATLIAQRLGVTSPALFVMSTDKKAGMVVVVGVTLYNTNPQTEGSTLSVGLLYFGDITTLLLIVSLFGISSFTFVSWVSSLYYGGQPTRNRGVAEVRF